MRAISSAALAPLLLCAAASGWTAPAEPQLLDERAAVARVLTILDERLALMPGVAAYKWQNHLAVSDPPREQVVIEHGVALARPLGLESQGVSALIAVQIRIANEVENALHGEWRARGFEFSGPIPSLTNEVRPRLDALTDELLKALYVAAPLIERAGFESRYAPLAAELMRATGWTAANRAELLRAVAAVSADPQASLQRIGAAHLLRAGTTGDYAPFSEASAAGLRGADIEITRALAQHLAAEPVFVHTTWKELLADLSRGRFDLAVGGISATPERAAAAALSIPYATGGKTILARCRDRARFADLAGVDRAGVRVIVNPGGTNEQFVRERVHQARILVHRDNPTIFDELVAGRADVMITDDTEVELQSLRHRELCRTYRGTLTHADKVMLLARDTALDASVDAWLKEQVAAGAPARLLRAALAR